MDKISKNEFFKKVGPYINELCICTQAKMDCDICPYQIIHSNGVLSCDIVIKDNTIEKEYKKHNRIKEWCNE